MTRKVIVNDRSGKAVPQCFCDRSKDYLGRADYDRTAVELEFIIVSGGNDDSNDRTARREQKSCQRAATHSLVIVSSRIRRTRGRILTSRDLLSSSA